MRTLNLIGCGRLGKTIAKLLVTRADYQMGGIFSRSHNSCRKALSFIGHGNIVSSYQEFPLADVFLLAVPDDVIADVVEELLSKTTFKSNTVVFHCSGALSSSILKPLKVRDVMIASAHPALSFASPQAVEENFKGSYCTIEGEEFATNLLKQDFTKMGAKCVLVSAEQKLFCHTAMVMACNYFTTLMDAAVRTCAFADLEEQQALELLKPLLASSFHQIFSLGPTKALTGPIMRGDVVTVDSELSLLKKHQSDLAALYQSMGLNTVEFAKRSGYLNEEQYLALKKVLEQS